VLVISRAPLDVVGVREFPVPALELRASGEMPDMEGPRDQPPRLGMHGVIAWSYDLLGDAVQQTGSSHRRPDPAPSGQIEYSPRFCFENVSVAASAATLTALSAEKPRGTA
jgi:hypothetical protein